MRLPERLKVYSRHPRGQATKDVQSPAPQPGVHAEEWVAVHNFALSPLNWRTHPFNLCGPRTPKAGNLSPCEVVQLLAVSESRAAMSFLYLPFQGLQFALRVGQLRGAFWAEADVDGHCAF